MPNVSLYQKFRTVDKKKYNKWQYNEKWMENVHPTTKVLPKLKVDFQICWTMQKGFGVYDICNRSEENTLYFEGKYKDNDILRYIILGTITMFKYIYMQDWVINENHYKDVIGSFKEKIVFTLDNDCNKGTKPFKDFEIEFEVVPKWEVFKRQIQDKFREVRRNKGLKLTFELTKNYRVPFSETQCYKEYNELTRVV